MAANKVEVRKYHNELKTLLENLSETSSKEIAYMCDHFKISQDTYLSILVCSCCQNTWSIFYDEKLLACCGVGKSPNPLDPCGQVWLMTTNNVKTHKKSFIKGCRIALAKALGKYPEGLANTSIKGVGLEESFNKLFGFQPTEEVDFYGTKFIRYVLVGDK